MLRAMRRNTKIVMLAVVLAFGGLMVFEWGMDVSGRSNPLSLGEVGSVNGTEISYQLWTATFRNITDQARQQKGSRLNDAELDLLEERAWNQLVNQILIEQELKRQGISVTDEEVKLAFRTTPPPWLASNELFQTDGEFDYEKYQQFFSGPAVDPMLLLQIEQYYRDVLPRARLFEQIASGIYVSDSELWDLYVDQAEQVRVAYMIIDPEAEIEDRDVTVTDEELSEYYRAHREEFEQPASAIVKFVEISRRPSQADSVATFEEAQALRQDILDGADFAELAIQHSDDPGSARNGGDLGWFGRGDMVTDLEEAAFEMEPGEISNPVLTPFGYHIIHLVERQDDRVRASHILLNVELTGESENDLFRRVDRLERIALRRGIDTAADSLDLEVAEFSLALGTDFVPGIGRFGPVHAWAFHDSTLIDELSPIYDTDDGFYAFELVERLPESILSFEDAEPSIRRRVLLGKKKETARWLADQIRSELEAGKSLGDVQASHDLALRTTELFGRRDFVPDLGQANLATGTAFGLEPNEVAGPIDSGDRLYFIELVERVEADREEFDRQKEQLRAQLTQQRRQVALDEWIADLRNEADIRDWRQEIFLPRS